MSTEDRELRREMRAKKRKKGCLISILCFIGICILAFVGYFSTMAIRDITGQLGNDKVYIVEIQDGAGTSSVANTLRNRGIIEYPKVFKLYSKLSGEKIYQKGRHTLSPSMSYKQIFEKLQKPADQGDENHKKVPIPEGSEARQIADILVKNGVITDTDSFMKELDNGKFGFSFLDKITRKENKLEGYLFPATYIFEVGMPNHDIITAMLTKFQDVVIPLYDASGTASTLDEIVTMASLIEREAANDDERGNVASVFNNRLYEGQKLESCATVQYIIKERKTVLTTKDTSIKSLYNTYRNSGLPIGPIASPGEASIKAALNPPKTKYMFFVADPDGSQNYFSETFEEHKKKIDELY
ncbi:MAG: endolytic transglycosylase MltG [Oscillospiraceae bacterium]